jgi:hypothetical protein
MASSKKIQSTLGAPNSAPSVVPMGSVRTLSIEACDSKQNRCSSTRDNPDKREPVEEFELVDAKLAPPLLSSPDFASVARDALRASWGRSATKSVKFNTVIRTSSTGSSGTFYAPVFNLTPNGSGTTEATTLASLYDECRCRDIEFRCRVAGNGLATSETTWAVIYDPGNSGAYSSVVGTGVVESSRRIGPIALNSVNPGTYTFTSTGFYDMKVKCPPMSPTAGAGSVANENVGSSWFATSDTAAIAGYLKWAVDAATSVTYTVEAFICYNMEYRMRT